MAGIDVAGIGQTGNFVSGNYLSAYGLDKSSVSIPFEIKQISYPFTVLNNGISITGVNDTDITFSNAGNYNIQFSVQVTCNTPQAYLFYLWLCINGSPVANSNSVLTIQGTHGGNNGHTISAWNFIVTATAGMTAQLCWTAENVAVEITPVTSPVGGSPDSPAVILSVNQI